MKQRINIVLFFISCLLSACSIENFGIDYRDMTDGEHLPVLIADNQSVSTRVLDNGLYFSIDDRIGVFMKKSGEHLSAQSISEGVDNIEYRCFRNVSRIGGHFAQVGEAVYYPVDRNQEVDFIAYYPYKSSIDNHIYPIDVTIQPEQKDSSNELDILYSNDAKQISIRRDTLTLKFDHMMTRLELELMNEQSTTYLNSTAVRITGLKRTAGLNLATGLIEQLGSPGDIEFNHPYTQIYRAFFIPQPAAGCRVYITTQSDGTLVYEFPPDMVFEPGKYYRYVITIKDKTQLEVSRLTITDWNGKDEEPIEKTEIKYQVGDYYPDPADPSTAIGIVYEITDGGYHGKMVSLDDKGSIFWGPILDESQSGVSGIRDQNDGSTATRSLIEKRKDDPGFSTTYGAFNWIYQEKNEGNINGRWYLPAINELKPFQALWYADPTGFDKKLTDAGFNMIVSNCAYRSSTEVNSQHYYSIDMDSGRVADNFAMKTFESYFFRVRAVSTF